MVFLLPLLISQALIGQCTAGPVIGGVIGGRNRGDSSRQYSQCFFHLCTRWIPEMAQLNEGKYPDPDRNKPAADLMEFIRTSECEVDERRNGKPIDLVWTFIGAPVKDDGKSYYPCEAGSFGYRSSLVNCDYACHSYDGGNPRFLNTQAGPSTGIEVWDVPDWAMPPWPRAQ